MTAAVTKRPPRIIHFRDGSMARRKLYSALGSCPGCSAMEGTFHKLGCVYEKCPECLNALAECKCGIAGIE